MSHSIVLLQSIASRCYCDARLSLIQLAIDGSQLFKLLQGRFCKDQLLQPAAVHVLVHAL